MTLASSKVALSNYSHVKMEEQEAAIAVLPAPPLTGANGNGKHRKKGT